MSAPMSRRSGRVVNAQDLHMYQMAKYTHVPGKMWHLLLFKAQTPAPLYTLVMRYQARVRKVRAKP